MSVLSDQEIWEALASGEIVLDPPPEPEQVSPSSIDLRLGDSFVTYPDYPSAVSTSIDVSKHATLEVINALGTTTKIGGGQSFTIPPHKLVLAWTLERVKVSPRLAARIEGRSSLARLGLMLHQTAPTVHATFEGNLQLELYNHSNFGLTVRPGIVICQLIVERLGAAAEKSLRSSFQGQAAPS